MVTGDRNYDVWQQANDSRYVLASDRCTMMLVSVAIIWCWETAVKTAQRWSCVCLAPSVPTTTCYWFHAQHSELAFRGPPFRPQSYYTVDPGVSLLMLSRIHLVSAAIDISHTYDVVFRWRHFSVSSSRSTRGSFGNHWFRVGGVLHTLVTAFLLLHP